MLLLFPNLSVLAFTSVHESERQNLPHKRKRRRKKEETVRLSPKKSYQKKVF